MLIPLLLIVPAILAAAVVAYGTNPLWAQHAHGLAIIVNTYRFEGLLIALVILLCLALVAVVVSGKHRVWWLIGLAPVLALFVHRFQTDPWQHLAVLDNPAVVAANRADFIADNDWVVGINFNGAAWAYPLDTLYHAPVVVQTCQDKRMIVLWSPTANRAFACAIGRDLRAHDLDIVSMPANALLLCNTRRQQFINGITGLTLAGQKPSQFLSPITTRKMTWQQWRKANPASSIIRCRPGYRGPTTPLPPTPPMALPPAGRKADLHVTLINCVPPIAIDATVIKNEPVNLSTSTGAVLAFRDKTTGTIHAYDRRMAGDLVPRFKLNTDPHRKHVFMVDPSDTNSGWSPDGHAVDGPAFKENRHLTVLGVEEDLPWGVLKYWYPDLQLADVH